MKVYAFDIIFNVRDKQGNLLGGKDVTLKLKNNTGFFLEDDSEGLLNGTICQTKSYVSSNIGKVTARVYFKTPEHVDIVEELVDSNVDSITPVVFTSNLLSLDFKTPILVGSLVDFRIKCVDPDLNGISETINILVDNVYYDSVQTDILGNATYSYNNTSDSGSQIITIESSNADSQTKVLVITDAGV